MTNKNQKLTTKQPASISTASSKKKISFFSAMMITVGSSVGAGIFLRSKAVLDGSSGSLVLAIFTWLLAAFAIISMALALLEIASGNTKNNLSIIGWCKQFNSRVIYKASKNFMFYIYLPLTFFFMPLYALLQLQDGIGAFNVLTDEVTGNKSIAPFTFGANDGLIWQAIGLGIALYFIFASYSSKLGNIQNLVFMALKFLPLVVAAFIGYVYVARVGGAQISPGFPGGGDLPEGPISLGQVGRGIINPFFGVTLAIAGIFFAYDGFYVTAGLQTEMKQPKKTPLALLFGLGLTTLIYLMIAISMSLNGTGNFYGFGQWLTDEGYAWVFGVVNILIAAGILGVVNGFAMWSPRFIEDLIAENELPFSSKFKNQLNPHHPKIGILYTLALTVPIFIIFTLIGAFGYIDDAGYAGDGYGTEQMGKLLSFADLMANWTAVFAFGFIAIAIYGGIKNRKTNRIAVDRKAYFLPFAYISLILMGIVLSITIIVPVFDLFLLATIQNGVGASQDDIVSRVMLFVTLVIFFALSFLPTVIEDKMAAKKGISLAENDLVISHSH